MNTPHLVALVCPRATFHRGKLLGDPPLRTRPGSPKKGSDPQALTGAPVQEKRPRSTIPEAASLAYSTRVHWVSVVAKCLHCRYRVGGACDILPDPDQLRVIVEILVDAVGHEVLGHVN